MSKESKSQYPEFYRNDQVELSVVIPLFNELEVLGLMYQKLKAIITSLGISHELLFVDDGSSDGTVEALAKISNHDSAVTVVLLARHFGKESALAAGLAQARSEEHTSELQSLMRISYAVFCLTTNKTNKT